MSKELKFKFDPNQEHQVQAIESTVKLFDGLPRQGTTFQMGEDIVPNLPPYETLDEAWLLDNLNEVQRMNGLPEQMHLDVDDGLVLDGIGIDSWRFPVYTVEMETGTGKTYVYSRTIHELRQHYGFSKFIIVVPSVAIYEGVLKSFQITKEHFKTLYGNETVTLTPYSGQQISKVRNFASSTFTDIMVMTIDAFNKSTNLFYKPTEKLPGERLPYQYIQETRPILILDESQNYLSPKSREALRTLHPLFAINYSATPDKKPNLIYRLTPVDAFKMDLVKKIEVLGVTEEQNYNIPEFTFQFNEPRAGYGPSIEAELNVYKDGVLKKQTLQVRKNDDLYEKTKNPQYQGLVIREINFGKKWIEFTNNDRLYLDGSGTDRLAKSEIFRIQIRETIKAHFWKQRHLISKGIKVLSLFFIDRVDNYVKSDGLIRHLFDEEYENLKALYPYFKGWKAEEVREGYFAKKVSKGQEEYIDTRIEDKTKEMKKLEKEAYELIMKKKERLLDFDEKVSFIFAHSALKEGWDNPNVFQICTLNTTYSEKKKRQEIGRGLRLAVDQSGERVHDDGINILTVIANESYESYVSSLQGDYRETGDVAPPKPTNARRKDALRNEQLFNGQDFQQLWDHLCRRTTYRISADTGQLVEQCIGVLNNLKETRFPEPHIVVAKGKFVMTNFEISLTQVKVGMAEIKIDVSDTDGGSDITKRWYKKGDSLAKIAKDERLKGFKIVEIKEAGEESVVHFGDTGSLRMDNPIQFSSEKGQVTEPKAVQEASSTYPVFNLIDRASQETKLTRKTIMRIFKGLRADVKEKIFRNPEGFSSVFIGKIREILANHIAENIVYELGEGQVDHDVELMFPPSKRFPQKELVDGAEWSLYDQVQVDSEVEEKFVRNRLNEDGQVICYFKFPALFKIQMPKIIGNYNPDWGVIRWDESGTLKLELVRETKGAMNPNLLQYPHEKRKIQCAEKHFNTIGVKYRQITEQIPNWWRDEQ